MGHIGNVKTIKEKHSLGSTVVTLKRDEVNGYKEIDTEVLIGDHHLCFISYYDRDAFLKALNDTIDKFKI